MLCTEKPENFSPLHISAAGCLVEWNGKILFLFRSANRKIDPNTWCTPGGKMEEGETKKECIAREMREEVGLSYTPETFGYIRETYCRYAEFDFVYHIFHVMVQEEPKVVLNEEHTKYAWFTPEEALTKPLIRDEDTVIRLVYGSHL